MRENVGLEAIQVVVSGGEKRGEKTDKGALQTFQNGGDDSKRRGSLIVVQWNNINMDSCKNPVLFRLCNLMLSLHVCILYIRL